MGFFISDDHNGVIEAWETAAATISTTGGSKPLSPSDLSLSLQIRSQANLRAFTHLSYDVARDRIVLTNGQGWIDSGANWNDTFNIFPPTWTHAAYDAKSLDPRTALNITDISGYMFPISGAASWFTHDHSTGQWYATYRDRYRAEGRTSGEFTEDYGNTLFHTFTTATRAGGTTIYTVDEELGAQAVDDTLWTKTLGLSTGIIAAKPIAIKGNVSEVLLPPVVMSDVVAYAYGNGSYYGAYVSLVKTDANRTYVSSRPIDLVFVFGLAPVGIDRFMLIGHIGTDAFRVLGQTAPLVALTYRYDRTSVRLELDDAAEIPTQFTYTWPDHVGHVTYDTKRQALVLLSPDHTTFERHVFDQQCHPIAPNIATLTAPVSPIQAGFTTSFAGATLKDVMPVGTATTGLTYTGSATPTELGSEPTEFATAATTGTGTFSIDFTSAASGAAMAITAAVSSFSVGISNQTTLGSQWGIEPVALLSTSAAFAVSATLSAAASPQTTTTSTIILAKRPIQDNDAGGGTPRELDHPLSGTFASPLIYPINPQYWTNILDQALIKPLYASTRTLEKTATVQYGKDLTDVEVVETWMGGGNRIAMSLSFFSSLWDMFAGDLDFVSQGFIQWSPRDLGNLKFKIIITDLTVGGQGGITVNHLARQGDGHIYESVQLKMRLIEQIT
jgi:hypothetical protein